MEFDVLTDGLIGRSKIDSIANATRGRGGLLRTNGVRTDTLMPWIRDQFSGQFAYRTVIASDGIQRLDINDVTVIGGWCAVRTADLLTLREGCIVDAVTGVKRQYRTVREVADWLLEAVSIDQCIEAIGIYAGRKYAAISEVQLWSDRVKRAVSEALARTLTAEENGMIDGAMERAEQQRYECTKRYLEYVGGINVDLRRIVDADVYDDLRRARDALLECAGTDVPSLRRRYPNDRTLDQYSLVWGMYAGPYLAALQAKKYVQTSKGIIVEPWFHATSESEAKAWVNERVFSNPANAYLGEGLSRNLGLVAFADVILPNGKRMRQAVTVDGVPNVSNYDIFGGRLSNDPAGNCLVLADNPVFMAGVNLFPYGDARNALLRMVEIRRQYRADRAEFGALCRDTREGTWLTELSDSDLRPGGGSDTLTKLQRMYKYAMADQASIVAYELQKMLGYVFGQRSAS